MEPIDQAGRARAISRVLAPPAELGPLVWGAWIQRYTDAIRANVVSWRVVPDLRPHLIVHRRLGEPPGSPRVVGARSTWIDVPVTRRVWSAVVALRPGVLPPLTGLPASELTDRSVPAEQLWGRSGARLAARVGEARTPGEVMHLLLTFLRSRVERPHDRVDWRVRGFTARSEAPGAGGVGELAAALGVSPRTLRDVWRRDVGLSPRESLSIGRVHRAVAGALASRPLGWSRLASAVGYHDQAHLIRDFRRFLGETPGVFMARGAPSAR